MFKKWFVPSLVIAICMMLAIVLTAGVISSLRGDTVATFNEENAAISATEDNAPPATEAHVIAPATDNPVTFMSGNGNALAAGAPARRIGQPNYTLYCLSKYGLFASAIPNMQGQPQNAWSWRCQVSWFSGGKRVGPFYYTIDVGQACQLTFRSNYTRISAKKENDSLSGWWCYGEGIIRGL